MSVLINGIREPRELNIFNTVAVILKRQRHLSEFDETQIFNDERLEAVHPPFKVVPINLNFSTNTKQRFSEKNLHNHLF